MGVGGGALGVRVRVEGGDLACSYLKKNTHKTIVATIANITEQHPLCFMLQIAVFMSLLGYYLIQSLQQPYLVSRYYYIHGPTQLPFY